MTFTPHPKPTKKPKTQAQISKKSASKKNYEAIYRIQVQKFKEKTPVCQANIEGICKHRTVDNHHRAGKEDIKLIMECFFLAVCRPCHEWIGSHPEEAYDKGLSLRRGHLSVTSAVRAFKANFDYESFFKQIKEKK